MVANSLLLRRMHSLLLLALCDWNRAIHLLTNAAVLGNTACMSVCTCICFALLIHKLFSAACSELPSLDSNNHIYLAGLFFFLLNPAVSFRVFELSSLSMLLYL